jgi:hypothetical protein
VPGKLTESGDADSDSVALLGLEPVRSTELPLELFFFRRPNFLRSFFTLGEKPSFVSCNEMYQNIFHHKSNYITTKINIKQR